MLLNQETTIKDISFVSKTNNEKIIRLLLDKHYSCKELSELTGLSHNGPSKIISRLTSLNIVKLFDGEDNLQAKPKGGQHIRYTINDKKGIFICISFFRNEDICWIYDFSGKLILEFSFDLPILCYTEHIESAKNLLVSKLNENNLQNLQVMNISIAIPGLVSTEKLIIVSPHIHTSVNIKDIFKHDFECEICVNNNSSIIAVGDIASSKINTEKLCVMSLYLGYYGISCTIWNDNKLISSKNGYSGEIGISHVENYGNLHNCCAFSNIVKEFNKCVKEKTVFGMIEASKHNTLLRKRILDSAQILGQRLNLFKTLIGLDKIFICGDVVNLDKDYFSILYNNLNIPTKYSSPKTELVISKTENATKDGLRLLAQDFAIKYALNT